jgi:hypothetical protein
MPRRLAEAVRDATRIWYDAERWHGTDTSVAMHSDMVGLGHAREQGRVKPLRTALHSLRFNSLAHHRFFVPILFSCFPSRHTPPLCTSQIPALECTLICRGWATRGSKAASNPSALRSIASGSIPSHIIVFYATFFSCFQSDAQVVIRSSVCLYPFVPLFLSPCSSVLHLVFLTLSLHCQSIMCRYSTLNVFVSLRFDSCTHQNFVSTFYIFSCVLSMLMQLSVLPLPLPFSPSVSVFLLLTAAPCFLNVIPALSIYNVPVLSTKCICQPLIY